MCLAYFYIKYLISSRHPLYGISIDITYIFEKRKLGFIEVVIRLEGTCVVNIDTGFELSSDSKAYSTPDLGVNLKICPQ